ncbi:MAG: UDP-N-acetylmuramate dehydrogenase [Eubacteriales bacterium]|nr:UDP-N-acetylmuramate dehydrogenase [Eubacteriales bacterium]
MKVQFEALKSLQGLQYNVSLATYTSLQIGGPADVFVEVYGIEDVKFCQAFAKQKKLPLYVIGKGCNLLVADQGVRGIVLHMGKRFAHIELQGDTILYAQSGATLQALSAFAEQQALAGLSFASGIPGTVGGAVVMNAGAYGGEMKDVVAFVDFLNAEGKVVRFNNAQMEFAYRHSSLQNTEAIVLGVGYQLQKGNQEEIHAQSLAYNTSRAEKQPLDIPSCGSAFQRPQGNYASALIEQCGLKGFRVGGCCVSTKHAGFLVNDGGATAKEYLELIHSVQNIVKEKTGYQLEPEVKQMGDFA